MLRREIIPLIQKIKIQTRLYNSGFCNHSDTLKYLCHQRIIV